MGKPSFEKAAQSVIKFYRSRKAVAVLITSFFFVICFVDPSYARLLKIGGNLSWSYQGTKSFTHSENVSTRSFVNSSSFQWGVNLSGQVPFWFWSSWYGNLSRSQVTSGFCGEAEGGMLGTIALKCGTVTQRDKFKTQTFLITTTHPRVLPVNWTGPLGLNYQKVNRETLTAVSNKDRVESFSGNWLLLSTPWLPRVTVVYQQSELQPQSGADILTKAASVTSDSSFAKLRVSAGYQFSQTETQTTVKSKTSAHSLNLDVQKEFWRGLTGSSYLRIAKFDLPGQSVDETPSPIAPGITIFPQRAYGGSLHYRPHLGRWDGRLTAAYNENPFFKDFKSLGLSGSANFRFSEKLRAGTNLRFANLKVSDSEVNSTSASGNLQYRPIFGLTTGVSAGWGLTDTSQASVADTESLFQNYLYHLNYTKTLRRFQYRTGYNLSYGLSDTRPSGFSSRNLSNTFQVGVDNTNTRIVHVGLTTSLNSIQNVTDSVKTDQTSYLVRVSADTNYFRNLLFVGDSVSLRVSDQYKRTTGFGISGRVNVFSFGSTYQVPVGLSLATTYRYEDYPDEIRLDRQSVDGTLSYSTRFFGRVGFNMILRDTFEDSRYQEDINRLEATFQLRYSIGKVRMFVRHLRVETRTSGNRFGSHSVYAQISRTF